MLLHLFILYNYFIHIDLWSIDVKMVALHGFAVLLCGISMVYFGFDGLSVVRTGCLKCLFQRHFFGGSESGLCCSGSLQW